MKTNLVPGIVPAAAAEVIRAYGDEIRAHTAPSGIEEFFAGAHDEFAKPGGPEMARVMTLAAERGLSFLQP